MPRLRLLLVICLVLGSASLLLFVLDRLALADIAKGEPDLSLEWRLVELSSLPVLLFHVVALAAAATALRAKGRDA